MTAYNDQLIATMLQVLKKLEMNAQILRVLASKLAVVTPVLKYGLLGAYTTKFVQEVRSSRLNDLLRKEAELKKLIVAQQLAEAMVLPYATTKISNMFKFVEEFIRQNLRIYQKMIQDSPKSVVIGFGALSLYLYRHEIKYTFLQVVKLIQKHFFKK